MITLRNLNLKIYISIIVWDQVIVQNCVGITTNNDASAISESLHCTVYGIRI